MVTWRNANRRSDAGDLRACLVCRRQVILYKRVFIHSYKCIFDRSGSISTNVFGRRSSSFRTFYTEINQLNAIVLKVRAALPIT